MKTLAFYAYIDGSNINEDWDAVKNYGICNYATITSNVFNNSWAHFGGLYCFPSSAEFTAGANYLKYNLAMIRGLTG